MKRHINIAFGLVFLAAMLVLAASAQAYTFNQVDTEFWVGSGANEALLIVDYNGYGGGSDGGPSFAFGFRWDGAAKGLDLFNAMNADGRLTVTKYNTTQSGIYYYNIGFAYDGLSYAWTAGKVPFRGGYGTDGEIWNSGTNGSFGSMKYGLDTITLANGTWFGYSVNSPGFLAPDIPQAPVPIPGALWMLGSGLLGLVGFRRRKAGAHC